MRRAIRVCAQTPLCTHVDVRVRVVRVGESGTCLSRTVTPCAQVLPQDDLCKELARLKSTVEKEKVAAMKRRVASGEEETGIWRGEEEHTHACACACTRN